MDSYGCSGPFDRSLLLAPTEWSSNEAEGCAEPMQPKVKLLVVFQKDVATPVATLAVPADTLLNPWCICSNERANR